MLDQLKTDRVALLLLVAVILAAIILTAILGAIVYISLPATGQATAKQIGLGMLPGAFGLGIVGGFIALLVWMAKRSEKQVAKRTAINTEKQRQEALAVASMPDHLLLEREIARLSARGWQIVNRTENAVQMKKPKRLNMGLALLGLILIVAFGFGLLLLLLAVLDYLSQKEKVIYFTAADIRAGNTNRY